MKLTPEAELTKYTKMLEYWKLNPIGHETTIKHLEIKVKYIELQVRNKRAYKRYKRQLDYKSKKEAAK
jgi:hypothetical protein